MSFISIQLLGDKALQRKLDALPNKLAKKVDTIQRELGSLGAVIMERIESQLEKEGIGENTASQLDETEREKEQQAVAAAELEEARATIEEALRELDELDEVHTVIFEQEMHRARSMLDGMLREIGERYEKPSRLDALRQELERAVREERYEDAARLRDHLRELGEAGEQPD